MRLSSLVLALCAAPRFCWADEAAPKNHFATSAASPARVEIALIGDLEQDPALFERIRSLFPRQTAVVLHPANQLDSGAVLRPQRPDTLYVWIRASSSNQARVYLAAREEGGGARYLFRDVSLEAGLDEIGSESLAQVAHSAAEALWFREQQTPEAEVVHELEQERPASTSPKPAPAPSPAPSVDLPISTEPATDTVAPQRKGARPAPFHFALGASFGTHYSGVEGWLNEPAIFLTTEFLEQFSLRFAAQYLLPTEFDVLPARVRLSGTSGELRAGWVHGGMNQARVRLEAGVGALLGRWSAGIALADPPAHASPARDFVRGYAVAAGALEWPLGFGWVAAHAELRGVFRRTSYEVEGKAFAVSSNTLNPGAALEFAVLLDPLLR